MSFVLWTADLATGFADIDEQHQILLARINGFYDAIQGGNFVDGKIALQDLIDYTAEHFAYEEKMLAEANYHMLEPHKKVHAHFVEKMVGLQGRYENGDMGAAQELLDILEGWLFRHIRLNDHGYVESVRKAGVRA